MLEGKIMLWPKAKLNGRKNNISYILNMEQWYISAKQL